MSAADRLEQVCFLLGVELGGADGTPPSIAAYDTYYNTHVTAFLEACQATKNKCVKKLGGFCEEAWTEQRKFLYAATACAKPSNEDLMAFINPIAKVIEKAGLFPRKTKVIDHWKAFNEAVQALNWLVMDGGGPYINSQKDAADFSLNKILRAARDDEKRGEEHKAWVKALKVMISELGVYCTTYHKQGIVWKFGGESVTDWKTPEAGAGAANKSEEDRLNDAVSALETYAAKMAGGSGDGPPPAVQAWKDLLDGEVKAFIDAAGNAELGLSDIGGWTTGAWTHTGRVIEATLVAKKPSDEDFGAFLGPISGVIGASSDPARGPTFEYVKGFNEMVQTLAWVAMPGGVDYIQSQIDASALYTNKLLRAAREAPEAKQAAIKAYVKALICLGKATKEYVSEWFKQGLIWRGKDGLPETYEHFPEA
jgi:hypothetical protein